MIKDPLIWGFKMSPCIKSHY